MRSSSSGFLAEMVRSSAARAEALAALGRRSLERRAAARPAPRVPVLPREGFDLVAEVKLASPALGRLAPPTAPGALRTRARAYAAGGACALSVLTEPRRFGGELAHLATVAEAVALPVLRKDFLVDPLQVLEARGAGAAGVLLVLRLLDETVLASMLSAARQCGLFALLEVFEAEELVRVERWLERDRLPPLWLGVNARDLATLSVDRGRHTALAPLLPAGIPWVAESGIEHPEDARRAAEAGYRLALVGGALMRAPAPRAAVAGMLASARAPRSAS